MYTQSASKTGTLRQHCNDDNGDGYEGSTDVDVSTAADDSEDDDDDNNDDNNPNDNDDNNQEERKYIREERSFFFLTSSQSHALWTKMVTCYKRDLHTLLRI